MIETDCSEIRKAIAAGELLVFETTLITHDPPATFPHVAKTAKLATSQREEQRFVAAIDIARARMARILPLASHESKPTLVAESRQSEHVPLPQLPKMDLLPADVAEVKPTTPAGRIDR